MSAYFGAIGSSLVTLQAIVNEDILHANSHAICTGWVTLLDELSFQIILLAIKSFDDLSTSEVVRIMTEYNDLYCRLYTLVSELKSYDTEEAQEGAHGEWVRYHVEQLRMRYEEVVEDMKVLQYSVKYRGYRASP
ncbi:hypothetical protein FA13DRAFT_1794173 [Coprinellus micaceus]|uniref:Uncharacterized protein n=1 Tax=Coprinellus micaceus TaxID=71717 RepID=A0A4Y7T1Z4_COPMI|nr:hypothetical protein FA13DRAFT_1794173 [Coprinellus micaceus]